MKQQPSPETQRLSVEERREAILQAAISEFAVHGLNGASTESIAERVGISQPYIFKIYGTKKELFIAAINRVYDDTLGAFHTGLKQHKDRMSLDAMGSAFEEMVTNREELLMLLQSVASTADEEIRMVVERRFRELYEFLRQHSQEDDFEIQRFIGFGLFLAALSGMGLDRSAFRSPA